MAILFSMALSLDLGVEVRKWKLIELDKIK